MDDYSRDCNHPFTSCLGYYRSTTSTVPFPTITIISNNIAYVVTVIYVVTTNLNDLRGDDG